MLSVRRAVVELVGLGQFPSESGASVERLKESERLLKAIERPLTKSEAMALLAVFGQDDCFGLAWSLLHLIETAPGWPYPEARLFGANPWVRFMFERAR